MAQAPRLLPQINIAIAGEELTRLEALDHNLENVKRLILKKINLFISGGNAFIRSDYANNVYNLDEEVSVRILTGSSECVEQLAIEMAKENNHKLARFVSDDINYIQLDSTVEALSFNASKLSHSDSLRDEFYHHRDDLLLIHSNILMVIWDGQVKSQQTSGVSWLVQQALMRNLPILWLDISKPDLIWHTNKFDHKLSIDQELLCQKIFYDMSVDQSNALKTHFFVEYDSHSDHVISQVFLPESLKNEIVSFFAHDFSLGETGGFDKFMHGFIRFSLRDTWSGIKKSLNFAQEKQDPNSMFTFLALAANNASGRHRSSIWLSFLLSFLAVLAAVIGALPTTVLHELHETNHNSIHWTTYAELGLIVAILGLLFLSKIKSWHSWWLPLRSSAEMFRYHTTLIDEYGNRALGIGSLSTQTLRSPASNWEHWLFKRVYSSLPLVDQSYLTTEGLRNYTYNLIEDQLKYHQRKHKYEHKLHNRLHTFSLALFILTFMAVIAHFFVHWPLLLLATAGFPALAAAIHGILTMSETERIADQSGEMAKLLQKYKLALDALPTEETLSNLLLTRNLAAQVVTTMVNENQTWNSLVSARSPELPA
jgi:hypothetical protein